MVDAECYQGEHEEEDDDYYGDYVVLFDHFGGLRVGLVCVWVMGIVWRRAAGEDEGQSSL